MIPSGIKPKTCGFGDPPAMVREHVSWRLAHWRLSRAAVFVFEGLGKCFIAEKDAPTPVSGRGKTAHGRSIRIKIPASLIMFNSREIKIFHMPEYAQAIHAFLFPVPAHSRFAIKIFQCLNKLKDVGRAHEHQSAAENRTRCVR